MLLILCQRLHDDNSHVSLQSIICASTLATLISTHTYVKQTTILCDLLYSQWTIGTIMPPIQPVLLLFHQFMIHENVSKDSASVQNPPRGHNYPSFRSPFHSQRISLVRYDGQTSFDHKSNNQLLPQPILFPPIRQLLALYQFHSSPLLHSCSATKTVWMRP